MIGDTIMKGKFVNEKELNFQLYMAWMRWWSQIATTCCEIELFIEKWKWGDRDKECTTRMKDHK